MTLGEAVEQLEQLDQDATIFAATPWVDDAPAVVIVEREDGTLPPEAAGLEYFLEVYIALEAAAADAGTRFQRVVGTRRTTRT